MNEQFRNETFLLEYLYNHNSAYTNNLHEIFNDDAQTVSNIISHSTSPIYNGLIKYDEENKTVTITNKGKKYVESKFSDRDESFG